MHWLNGLIGGVAGAVSYYIFSLIFKNKPTLVTILAIASAVVAINLSKPFVTQRYEAYKFEEEIKKYPLFNLIAQSDPEEFKNFIDKSKNSIYINESPDKVTIYSQELVSSVFKKHILKASDESIFNYIIAQIYLYKELNKDNPELIVKLEMGQADPRLSTLFKSEKYKALSLKLLQAKENVILSSINSNTTEINKSAIENNLKEIITNLAKNFGQQEVYLTFTKPNDPNLESSKKAQIIISFYESILNSGKENAAQIIKYLFMQK
ncbi:TPA: hypothetical protein ACU0X0_002868 [Legionella anisa]